MELYILGPVGGVLRPVQLIDTFESFIWTERYSDLGDFELVIKSTPITRNLLTEDTKILCDKSERVMIIESVEDKNDADGNMILDVKGHSLETIMNDRLSTHGPTTYEGFTPEATIKLIINHTCIHAEDLGGTVYEDYPGLSLGSLFPFSHALPSPSDGIWWNIPTVTMLFDEIKKLADSYGLGFRIVYAGGVFTFNVCTGTDRTTDQTDVPAIIFSSDLDNLQAIDKLSSIEKYKNVAYVHGGTPAVDEEYVTAVLDGFSSDYVGFDRRMLYLDVTDIPSDVTDIAGYLNQKGLEALTLLRKSVIFDGELNQSKFYKYGVDYNLGDIVEMRDNDNNIFYKKVTEQIFISDSEGERSYPTLS